MDREGAGQTGVINGVCITIFRALFCFLLTGASCHNRGPLELERNEKLKREWEGEGNGYIS